MLVSDLLASDIYVQTTVWLKVFNNSFIFSAKNKLTVNMSTIIPLKVNNALMYDLALKTGRG